MSHFAPESTPSYSVGCKPAAYAAEVLDRAQVPNMLWGWWAVGLVGRHYGFPASKPFPEFKYLNIILTVG